MFYIITKDVIKHAEMKTYSGPFPPPEILVGYDAAVPGFAEKLSNQFIAQGQHRMAMEQIVVRGDDRRAYLGMWLGFVLALVTIVGSLILVYQGKEIVGFGALVVGVGTLAGVFVYGTESRKRERIEKEKARPSKQSREKDA